MIYTIGNTVLLNNVEHTIEGISDSQLIVSLSDSSSRWVVDKPLPSILTELHSKWQRGCSAWEGKKHLGVVQDVMFHRGSAVPSVKVGGVWLSSHPLATACQGI